MALVALASAKGSPGVTTTALALGALWPRPVLVAECDPSGGDVAVRLPRADGGVLDPDRGLVSLTASARRGLHPGLVPDHTQQVLGGLDVLVGPREPEQAAGMTSLWPHLGSALDAVPGTDVLADCGRVGPGSPQLAVLRAARTVLMVCRPTVASVVHLRERLSVLDSVLRPGAIDGVPIGVVVIAEPGDRRGVAEVRDALGRLATPLSRVWQVALDDSGAAVFRGDVSRRADRTALVRSAAPVAAEVAAALAAFFVAAHEPDDDSDPDGAAPGDEHEAEGAR